MSLAHRVYLPSQTSSGVLKYGENCLLISPQSTSEHLEDIHRLDRLDA